MQQQLSEVRLFDWAPDVESPWFGIGLGIVLVLVNAIVMGFGGTRLARWMLMGFELGRFNAVHQLRSVGFELSIAAVAMLAKALLDGKSALNQTYARVHHSDFVWWTMAIIGGVSLILFCVASFVRHALLEAPPPPPESSLEIWSRYHRVQWRASAGSWVLGYVLVVTTARLANTRGPFTVRDNPSSFVVVEVLMECLSHVADYTQFIGLMLGLWVISASFLDPISILDGLLEDLMSHRFWFRRATPIRWAYGLLWRAYLKVKPWLSERVASQSAYADDERTPAMMFLGSLPRQGRRKWETRVAGQLKSAHLSAVFAQCVAPRRAE